MARHASNQIALTVGRNVRAARDARDLTQQAVAQAIGVTSRDISRWETGRVEPGPFYRQRLAEFLFGGDVSALYREPEEIAA